MTDKENTEPTRDMPNIDKDEPNLLNCRKDKDEPREA